MDELKELKSRSKRYAMGAMKESLIVMDLGRAIDIAAQLKLATDVQAQEIINQRADVLQLRHALQRVIDNVMTDDPGMWREAIETVDETEHYEQWGKSQSLPDNNITIVTPCFMPGCTDQAYRWWPRTTEGLRHEGQSMDACEKHFHEVWAGEN